MIFSSMSIVASLPQLPTEKIEDISDQKMLLRIYDSLEHKPLPRDVEIVGVSPNEWVDIIIYSHQLTSLILQGYQYDIQISDVNAYLNSVRGTYHSLAEMETLLQNIATSYPSITRLFSIGQTYEGRDIWCLEITDNPGIDEGEPGVLLMGLHHAREWPSLEICLHVAEELTGQYGSDPTITDIVDNRRIWLVTCVNPDGYYWCHDLGHDWRKNRRYFPEFGEYGVDLNRNYGGASDGDIDGIWGSLGVASVTHKPDQELYCGPEPFSENETKAVRDLLLQNKICAAISWHTHGQLVLWSYGYSYTSPPDGSYLSSVGTQIAQEITRQSGSGTYTPQQGAALYPTTGDTTDWAYGYHHYIQGLPCFAYTIEACDSFHPSASYLDQVVAENFDGALVLLQEAENITDTVIPRVLPPEITDMTTDPDGNYTISWIEQNTAAEPTKFQLDELTDLTILEDDAEATADIWEFKGFSSSTTRAYSGAHSYKSHYGNEETSGMLSRAPLIIEEGMELSFWCWYTIEENWDYAFVEISRNGRSYDFLDSFTGSSDGWVQKQYPLDDYVDDSIFIRFRYTTDANTLEEGFYVDDIAPVPNYGSISTLSDMITTNSYAIVGRPEGIYHYRVCGYNEERGWGDFSQLEAMNVTMGYNQPPEIPTIQGRINGKIGIEYTYTFLTSDPNIDQIYYYIEWGDDSNSGWQGPYNSSESLSLTHSWTEKGVFQIKCKAKDIYDVQSDWGLLEVSMPNISLQSLPLVNWLIHHFPLLYKFFQL